MSKPVVRLLDAATLICALVLTGVVIKRELVPADERPRQVRGGIPVSNWDELRSGGHRIGADSAAITIVEFSDFQCPFCAHFAGAVLAPALRRHPAKVAVVYRHWPLSIHPFAADAAIASECGAEQGQFKSYHDALFAYQDSIGIWSFERFAQLAKIPDLHAFASCMSGASARRRVERDRRAALDLAAPGTPTFIVNGIMLSGALDSARIDSLVRASRR